MQCLQTGLRLCGAISSLIRAQRTSREYPMMGRAAWSEQSMTVRPLLRGGSLSKTVRRAVGLIRYWASGQYADSH
jgi:hypothetical protein